MCLVTNSDPKSIPSTKSYYLTTFTVWPTVLGTSSSKIALAFQVLRNNAVTYFGSKNPNGRNHGQWLVKSETNDYTQFVPASLTPGVRIFTAGMIRRTEYESVFARFRL